MATTTDMNVILGQAEAIKEIQHVKRQQLELNQQFTAQKAEVEKREEKSRVQRPDQGDKVEVKDHEGKREGQRKRRVGSQKQGKGKKSRPRARSSGGTLIDIRI